MESNRQKKIAGVLQNDLASILQKTMKDAGHMGILISVSKVSVTVDLSIAKVYLSIFPSDMPKNWWKKSTQLKEKSNIRHHS